MTNSLMFLLSLLHTGAQHTREAATIAVGGTRHIPFDTMEQLPDYDPVFHIRPPGTGHVNDPNGPFRDPTTGVFHLFCQYTEDSQGHDPKSWAHFVSADLARWAFLGIPIRPSTSTSCPDMLGCYTGSATIVNGTPSIMYPGVHTSFDPTTNASYLDMDQCLALPANRSDPLLREWTKQLAIPSDSRSHNVSRLRDEYRGGH